MVSPITTCYRNVFFLLSKPQSADFSQSNSDRFRKFAGFFFSFKLPSMLIPTKINSVDCIFLKSNHVLFPFFSDFKVCKSFSQSRNPGSCFFTHTGLLHHLNLRICMFWEVYSQLSVISQFHFDLYDMIQKNNNSFLP